MKTRTKLLATIASAAGAAAGYYFFAAKNAKQNRKLMADWADNMKTDVMKRARQMKTVDRAAFAGVIDSVAKAYKGVRNLDQKDLKHAADELKDNWEKLLIELKQTGVLARKEAGKTMDEAASTMRTTAKKVSSRVTKVIAKK